MLPLGAWGVAVPHLYGQGKGGGCVHWPALVLTVQLETLCSIACCTSLLFLDGHSSASSSHSHTSYSSSSLSPSSAKCKKYGSVVLLLHLSSHQLCVCIETFL